MASIALQFVASIGLQVLKGFLAPDRREGPQASTIERPSSQYGDGKNRIWGRARCAGTLIWAKDKIDKPYETGGKGSVTTNHAYYGTFAYLIGEGPLELITIYLNNKVWWSISENASAEQLKTNIEREKQFTYYVGTPTQLPDPLIQADLGVNRTPGHRDSAYIVFNEIALEEYGNSFPLPSFEVVSEDNFSPSLATRKGLVEGVSYTFNVSAYDNQGELVNIPTTSPDAIWGCRIMNVTSFTPGEPRGEIQIYGKNFTKTIAAGRRWGSAGSGGPGSITITDIQPSALTTPNAAALTPALIAPVNPAGVRIVYTRASDLSLQVITRVGYVAPFYVGPNISTATTYLFYGPSGAPVGSEYFSQAPSSAPDAIGYAIFDDNGSQVWLDTLGILGIHGWQDSFVAGPILTVDYSRNTQWGDVKITSLFSNADAVAGTSSTTASDLSQILDYVMESCSIAPSDYDFSAVATIPVRGYLFNGVTSAKSFLETLQRAYLFNFFRDGGRMVAKPLGEVITPLVSIQNKMLMAQEGEPAYTQDIADPELMPASMELTYPSVGKALRTSTQQSRRYPFQANRALFNGGISAIDISERNYLKAEIQALLNENEALTLVYQSLSIILSRKRNYSWIWPIDMLSVTLNQVYDITFPYSGYVDQVMITSIDLGKNNSLVIKGVSFDAAFKQISLEAEDPSSTIVDAPGNFAVDFAILDIPAWRTESEKLVMYAAAYTPAASWTGATVYASLDSGASFNRVSDIGTEGTVGKLLAGLEPVNYELIDYRNKISLRLNPGANNQLASIGDVEFLDSTTNLLALGGEILKFKNALLVGPGEYELSTLRRGLFGTWQKTNTHQVGASIVRLDSSVISLVVPPDKVDQIVLLRFVPNGQAADVASNVTIVPRGNSLKPLPAVNIMGQTNQTPGDITITWKRVARGNAEWSNFVDVPVVEISERYSIDIYSNTNQFRRTYVTTSPTLVYPLVDRTIDIGTDLSFGVEIFQLGDAIGRGFGAKKTIQV